MVVGEAVVSYLFMFHKQTGGVEFEDMVMAIRQNVLMKDVNEGAA